MKSVLISTQPKWCELIASGKKPDEVRKTKPKLEPPFKCYIYCTKGKFEPHEHLRNNLHYDESTIKVCEGQGKVIGEFVCDRFTFIDAYYDTNGNRHLCNTAFIKSCVPDDELFDYLYGKHGEKHGGWAWHISDLVIYEKPKELSEFYSYDARIYIGENGFPMPTHAITRPPQSWCYVKGWVE